MKRRTFFKSATALTVGTAAAGLAAPAIAQERRTWRMVTAWPKDFPGLGTGAQRLADRITRASGGRLNIQVYAAGEVAPALEALDAVIDGRAEMSHGAAYYWQNRSDALAFFTGVPFGLTGLEHAAWMRHLGGQAIWDEIYDQFGVIGFMSGSTGVQAGGWFRNKLHGVADIAGLKFRTPGMGGQVWEKLGASTKNLPAGEIYSAFQRGELDAAEFVGPYNDLRLGFYQIAKNYYFPSFIEPAQATELVVNKALFLELPDDLQEIVRIVCQAEYDQVASDFHANDPQAMITLVKEHGVQVRRFPEEILAAGAKAAMEIVGDRRQNGDALTKKTVESFLAALSLMRAKTEGNDLQYLIAREKYARY